MDFLRLTFYFLPNYQSWILSGFRVSAAG